MRGEKRREITFLLIASLLRYIANFVSIYYLSPSVVSGSRESIPLPVEQMRL